MKTYLRQIELPAESAIEAEQLMQVMHDMMKEFGTKGLIALHAESKKPMASMFLAKFKKKK